MPIAPGLRQMRPRMTQPQVPTPGGQGTMQATPYRQQVFPPKRPAPSRAPLPVPAGIWETRLKRLEALGAGPLLGDLRKGGEGAGPPREDLKSATGLIQMTA